MSYSFPLGALPLFLPTHSVRAARRKENLPAFLFPPRPPPTLAEREAAPPPRRRRRRENRRRRTDQSEKLEESLKNSKKQNWNFAFLAASAHETIKVIVLGVFLSYALLGRIRPLPFLKGPLAPSPGPRALPVPPSPIANEMLEGGRGPLFSFYSDEAAAAGKKRMEGVNQQPPPLPLSLPRSGALLQPPPPPPPPPTHPSPAPRLLLLWLARHLNGK